MAGVWRNGKFSEKSRVRGGGTAGAELGKDRCWWEAFILSDGKKLEGPG
jgi:hypothetical protein